MADNGFLSSSSLSGFAGNTLPEHHSALALLQQLDHAWFHDNLIKPRVGLINAFLLSSDRPLSPYQSVELVDATHRKWGSSACPDGHGRGEMPCTRFEALPLSETPATAQHWPDNRIKLQRERQFHQASVPPGGTDRPLTPRRHVSTSPLVDIVLAPPIRVQTWSVDDFQQVKESQVTQITRVLNLESVEPGKQLTGSLVDTQLPQSTFRVRKAYRKSSSSMTALEFDELQGFVDLGFQFSQDDPTPGIVTMLPVLKHKVRKDGELGVPRVYRNKPKQSSLEAWLVQGSTVPLHDRHSSATNEDMKEHLKFWARAVASTVRQEC